MLKDSQPQCLLFSNLYLNKVSAQLFLIFVSALPAQGRIKQTVR